MDNVMEIELVFENTDSVRIDTNNIGWFMISDVSEEVRRIAVNAITRYLAAKEVAFEIFSEADKPFFDFGDDSSDGTTIFKRILVNDITSIIVLFNDGTKAEYFPKYSGDEVNKLQISKISSLGNLYVTINADMEEIFPEEEIENKKEMAFKKRMYMG